MDFNTAAIKDIQAVLVRHVTAATAAITLAFMFGEILCYVLGRLHSSCVLSTKMGCTDESLLIKLW